MHKRGSRFFVEYANDEKCQTKGTKGRSADLLKVRNDKLFHRYYYHSKILQLKYERVLLALRNEFDLTESTLIQLIEKNTKWLKEIADKKMTRAELKKQFPFFMWNDKAEVHKEVKRETYNRY